MWLRPGPALLLALLLLPPTGCGGDDGPRRGVRDAGGGVPDVGPPPPRDAGTDAGPAEDDLLSRAAVVMSSCIGGSAGALLLEAYAKVETPDAFSRLLREHALCLATAGTGCEAIDTCLGIELDVAGDCTAGCDGATAVICGASHIRWRCDAVGLTCADGTCVPDDGTCTDASCDGERPVLCASGNAQRGPDCAAFGLTCATTGAGAPGCVGTGEVCESTALTDVTIDWLADGIECVDRDHFATCINGARHEIACADIALGTRCRTTTDVDMRPYCGLSAECNPFTTVVEFCSGNDLTVCNVGRLEQIGCIDLGFSRCASGRCQ